MKQEVENIFNDIKYLLECQRFLVERTNFLELKQLEIRNRIKNIDFAFSEEKCTLENQINQMEISLNLKVDDVNKNTDNVERIKSRKKCRYNNGVYCKLNDFCKFLHSNEVCEEFLLEGKCSDQKECMFRHPKMCKFWVGDHRGCLWGAAYKYMHKSDLAGTKLSDSETEIGEKKTTKDKKESTHTVDKPEKKKEESKVEQNVYNKYQDRDGDKAQFEVSKLEKILIDKGNLIASLGDKSIKMENKNTQMKEKLDRLKQVTLNLHSALKVSKRSATSDCGGLAGTSVLKITTQS